jgi:hypothetical protein
MAWYPGCIKKEVTRHRTPMAGHRGICLHIAVSTGASLFNYFNQPGNPTSHFYVRFSGEVEQYVDTKYRAPAQLDGNPTMVGVETQGGVGANLAEGWYDPQRESLADLCAWLHKTHGIPLQAMPNSKPSTRGVGYHKLGVDPYRVTGGELWSESFGKVCPGDVRIAQIPSIITRAKQILTQEDDGTMAWTDAQIASAVADMKEAAATLNEIATLWRTHAVRMDNLVNQQLPGIGVDVDEIRQNTSLTASRLGTQLGADLGAIRVDVAQVDAKVDEIGDDIDTIRDSNTPNPDAD